MSNKICSVWHFESMDDVNLFIRACELKWLAWNMWQKPTESPFQSIPLSINIWDDNTITHLSMSKLNIDFRDKIKEMCPNYIVSTKEKTDIPWLLFVWDYCNWESVRIENGEMQGSYNPGFYHDKKHAHLFVTADEYNRIMRNDEPYKPVFWYGVKDMIKSAVDTGSSVSYSGWAADSTYSTAKSAREHTAIDMVREWCSRDMLQEDLCTMTYKWKSRLTFKKVL